MQPRSLNSVLFPAAISFAAGIIAFELPIAYWIFAIGLICTIVLFLLRRNYPAILLLTFLTGQLDAYIHNPAPLPESIFGHTEPMSGVVIESREGETSHRLIIEVDSLDGKSCRKFRLLVYSWNFLSPDLVGRRMNFDATLRPIEHHPDLPYETDRASYLQRRGVVAQCSITDNDIQSVSDASGIYFALRRMQFNLAVRIIRSDMNDFTRELLVTLLTGDSEIMPQESRELFSKAGVAHLLALSGLHVAIISLIVGIMLWPLLMLGMRRIRAILVILFLWGFAVITGLTPSVVRAVIMATVLFITRILERRPTPLNSLSFAALMILLFDPTALWSIGFQLTFTAVLSILLLAGRLNPFPPRNRRIYYPMSLLTLSFSAMVATGVIAAFYFHCFPIYFLLANIPATFLLPLIIGGGVLFLLLSAVDAPLGWIEATLDFLCGIIQKINEFVSVLPGSSIDNAIIPLHELLLLLLFIAILTVWLYRPKTVWMAASLVSLAILTILHFSYTETVSEEEIYLPRFGRTTNLLVPSAEKLTVLTTALMPEYETVTEQCRRRYAEYLLRLGTDSIEITNVDGKIIGIGEQTFFLSGRNNHLSSSDSIGNLIICRGFTDDIVNYTTSCRYGQLILSSDLHPVRLERYRRELDSAGIPYIVHRDSVIVFRPK